MGNVWTYSPANTIYLWRRVILCLSHCLLSNPTTFGGNSTLIPTAHVWPWMMPFSPYRCHTVLSINVRGLTAAQKNMKHATQDEGNPSFVSRGVTHKCATMQGWRLGPNVSCTVLCARNWTPRVYFEALLSKNIYQTPHPGRWLPQCLQRKRYIGQCPYSSVNRWFTM